ncbi:MAG: hypothetical protein KTR32_34555 [Granulosicoccus sp.]|nr:hypothetical protein [Granulosicoccus sp.]
MPSSSPPNDVFQHPPGRLSTLQNADWAALRLLNQYRLYLLVALTAVFYLADGTFSLGSRNLGLFKYTLLLYTGITLVFSGLIHKRTLYLETQFYLQAYVDILVLATLTYASGGIQSGLAMLLVVHIAIIGHCTKGRYAMLFAAITTSVLLSQELYARLQYGSPSVDLSQTALLCSVLFAVAYLTSVVLHARAKAPDVQQISMKRIAELNQQIIQELESGVLYIDRHDNIQLINETACSMLRMEESGLPIPLKLACEPLADALRQWRNMPTAGNRPLETPLQNRELLPTFTEQGTDGVLIKLDDHSLIRQQLQQLKLASLGRLSASIAHEIRNPLGAITNAVQLLAESDRLNAGDNRLIDIAQNHTRRINRIVTDVLSLSNAQRTNIEQIHLATWLNDFRERFINENSITESAIGIKLDDQILIQFDSLHLDQILWNLCNNSLMHNENQAINITIRCYVDADQSVVLEVADDGVGIASENEFNLFEPFFTTNQAGTGLGLYVIRGLCDLNQARIDYIASSPGACFRITLASSLRMAA